MVNSIWAGMRFLKQENADRAKEAGGLNGLRSPRRTGNGGAWSGYSVKFALTWYTRPPQPSSGNASDTLT